MVFLNSMNQNTKIKIMKKKKSLKNQLIIIISIKYALVKLNGRRYKNSE